MTVNLWLIPFGLLMLSGIVLLIAADATAKPPPPRVISEEQHREQLAELRKGIMPCRFCGLDWFWTGNRHDPLKLAGVKTMAGQSRHGMRGLTAAWARMTLTVVSRLTTSATPPKLYDAKRRRS